MTKQHLAIFGAAAVLAVGAVWAGAPASTVLVVAILLACPLMMLLMMKSMSGGHAGHDHAGATDRSAREWTPEKNGSDES